MNLNSKTILKILKTMILQWWGYMYFHDLITEQIKTVTLTLFPCKLQWLELGRAAAQIISGDVFFLCHLFRNVSHGTSWRKFCNMGFNSCNYLKICWLLVFLLLQGRHHMKCIHAVCFSLVYQTIFLCSNRNGDKQKK